MVRNKEKKIVEPRIKELFQLAIDDEKFSRFDEADRKYEMMYLYSSKYKIRIPVNYRTWICRKCKSGIYSSGGHVRIKKSMVSTHCGKCGYVRRYPTHFRSSQQ